MTEQNGCNVYIATLPEHEHLKAFAKKGLCRVWSKNAKEVLLAMQPDLRIEIREVDIEPGLSHTFLRVFFEESVYLLDGTGVEDKAPFFGLETEAPLHLLNSHEDMIEVMI